MKLIHRGIEQMNSVPRRLVAVLLILAVMTAIVSGKEAMGMGPVRAVREDW